ncbi:hypothetical protein DM860_010315 [Cuscuta australis]|uniref:Uncharacterized protein n=1 Tax=Cuscuta australis TaxID=267555 RepID=A0A328DB41_9ASTE|nr:hypothetical protein DM860_010315 [Cuscuta australis]
MQCSKETIFRLFYNASSSFLLVLLSSYFASICLAKLLRFLGGNIFFFLGSKQVAYAQYSDEEDEDMCNYQSTLFASEAAHGGNKGIVVNDPFSGSDPEESSGSEAATAYYSCPNDDVMKQYNSLHLHRNTNKSVLDTLHSDKHIEDCYEEVKKEKREKKRNVMERESLNEIAPSKNQEKEEKSNKEEEEDGGDSLEWIETCPRSKSEREPNSEKHSLIRNKKLPWECPNNPYHELEAAYVAQICLTWEALKWNYNYFLSTLIMSSSCESEPDRGCPATTAQQFQQFQVLLQRYIENEAYENGRRPEIYVRMRSLAPMLLQVPHCISGVCSQKKSKLKEIRISGKKSSTRRWLGEEEEMERLMAHIDLKVVSRVLKMAQVNDKQLHWCEEKMSRVKFCDGKLLRDQFLLCPLFYPLS